MSNTETVAELLELAIAAEKASEELYRGLETKFARYKDVADFWGKYAAEEASHARWLENLRDTAAPEQLSAPADPRLLIDAHQVLKFSVEDALQEIRNLEDAYELANELEHSETNVIFEFLIDNFSSGEKTQVFLRAQLKDHIARLMIDFPTRFKHPTSRRAIKALE